MTPRAMYDKRKDNRTVLPSRDEACVFYPKATGSRLSVVKKGACAQPLCIRVIRAAEPPGLRYPDRIMIENKSGPFVHCRIKTNHYTSPGPFLLSHRVPIKKKGDLFCLLQ